MSNDKLQKVAHRFVDVTREIKHAKRRVSEAHSTVATLQGELSKLKQEMAEYIGPNISHRLVATPAGTVTLSHGPAKDAPIVRVFDAEGEEVIP